MCLGPVAVAGSGAQLKVCILTLDRVLGACILLLWGSLPGEELHRLSHLSAQGGNPCCALKC